MARILDIIYRLLPNGTVPGRRRNWTAAPPWPPDMFAVTAFLVNASGCYSGPRYTNHGAAACYFTEAYRKDVVAIGEAWAKGKLPRPVEELWRHLISNAEQEILGSDTTWCDTAMKLMATADEASAGVGFVDPAKPSPIPDYLADQHWRRFLQRRQRPARGEDLPYLPDSLCWRVPTSEVCVQPKVRTPQVGCTLRSLSHHLALLPPLGELKTRWLYAPRGLQPTDEPLNLLLVPFPYRIDGNGFAGDEGQNNPKFFTLDQTWLRPSGRRLSPRRMASYLSDLVDCASNEVRRVHGLVLPELALDASQILEIAAILARQTELELLITGVAERAHDRKSFPKNKVFAAIFHHHRVLTWWEQTKHHRWRLDGDQIRRYQLGDALDPRELWWERIQLGQRVCTFYVFRHGASLATLVCEDLARIDPVQAALRAVGPNLVIVLLMDGPQFERRWPGRYATVLADDPGSAVLTLTSFGMVRRSSMPGEEECREIALWKESPSATAIELKLPQGAHALLATLSQSWETNFTLDGRTDRDTTMRMSLSGLRGIVHPKPPSWLAI